VAALAQQLEPLDLAEHTLYETGEIAVVFQAAARFDVIYLYILVAEYLFAFSADILVVSYLGVKFSGVLRTPLHKRGPQC
jgi:hypothetical protein